MDRCRCCEARYDAALKGPEIINERMSATQAKRCYGFIYLTGLFVVFVALLGFSICRTRLPFRSSTVGSLFVLLGRSNPETTSWLLAWELSPKSEKELTR